jgi:putative addiction module killer protein
VFARLSLLSYNRVTMELLRYQREDGREPFTDWLAGLRDKVAAARIRLRLRQVEAGNFGDSAAVGEGVIELRVHIGAGYRVYCARHGKTVVILLCGGDKSTQPSDIKQAKELWSEWKRRQKWAS